MTKTPVIKLLLPEYKKQFITVLHQLYDTNEAQHFFYLLCETYLGFSRVDVSLNYNYELNTEKKELFEKALERLQQQEPIQYIIGTTYFYGNTFTVTPNTLIPRPETEELVDWIIKDHETKTTLKIVDIGTGSGCIAITLAKHLPKAVITAIEVSNSTLKVAKKNALNLQAAINFKNNNILNINQFEEDYDIIVSNPPYVRMLEKKEMKANVLDFEPDTALFVSDRNPLIFYHKIAQLVINLNFQSPKKRILYFEINEYLATETAELLTKLGFNAIKIKKDFRGKPRMVRAYLYP